MIRVLTVVTAATLLNLGSMAIAQSVCLPAPRLLTTMPMGGNPGSQVEITITGENLDNADELAFTDPRLTAVHKLDAAGQPELNKYLVTIAADCPTGLYEARVTTRLGLSSSRIFSVGTLPEVERTKPNTTIATAMELKLNSLCNAATTAKAVDHYLFEGRKGQRIVADCATRGIDSKLDAVLIIASATGNDLLAERRSGVLDFTAPEDGKYLIKVHGLTFSGGPAFYYRLALQELPAGAAVVRLPSTNKVSSVSWPPAGLKDQAEIAEVEPNHDRGHVQKISLPCDIAGSFFPAADVDVFEFEAKKGEEWWIEVASERLGLPTDPAVLVQHVSRSGANEKLTDVVELNDIASPMRVSSNAYTYDGPPYDAGSSDVLGKLVIKEDGIHRLQLTDLFGGTRNDPSNIYRLVVRKAQPDFALAGWALHMELRNGDRNALSKPLALRGGLTMALEVGVIRRDGFDGPIELVMDGLPEGVTAQGLTIPAGSTRGMMLVTAHQNAPKSLAAARFYGRAQINDVAVERPCRLASMAWPVPEAWNEIPYPRLLADVPVSVGGSELAPVTLAATKSDAYEVAADQKLTIPLTLSRRSEFSGSTLKLKTMGTGFEKVPAFDISLTSDSAEAVLDLGVLKTPPGDHVIAFYGSAVAKYRYHPEEAVAAEEAHRKAEQERMAQDAEVTKLTDLAKAAAAEVKADADTALEAALGKQKAAVTALAVAAERMKKATEAAKPKDLVDIVVSEPITIRVMPAEKK